MGELAMFEQKKPIVEAPAASTSQQAKPKQAVLPDVRDLSPGAERANLDGASKDTLLTALEHRVDEMYAKFDLGLENALNIIREPPPPADESFALKALALLVEGITGFAIGRFGSIVSHKVESLGSEDTASAVKDVFKNYAKAGSLAAGQAAVVGHVRDARGLPAVKAINHKSKQLVDEYAMRQKHALIDGVHEAKIKIALVRDVMSRLDRGALQRLADALSTASDIEHVAEFEYQVVTGWMNFCASISLGQQSEDPAVDAARTWSQEHDGYIDIRIHAPDEIEGTRGLTLEKVGAALAGPGAARTLRDMNEPLLRVPVYRRVVVEGGPTKLEWYPVMAMTPEGKVEVDAASNLLAAIGRGVPTPNVGLAGRSEPGAGRPTAGELVRADEARAGADKILAWLSQFTTEQVES